MRAHQLLVTLRCVSKAQKVKKYSKFTFAQAEHKYICFSSLLQMETLEINVTAQSFNKTFFIK